MSAPEISNTIQRASTAYGYPLLIKQLLHAPMVHSREQEIVYRDLRRHSYADFRTRIGQLANALRALGVAHGDTVAVMDWDSHRYLEAYFAVPMMGATLMTVNVRLSNDQIAYTLNHSQAKLVFVNAEFAPVLDAIRDKLTSAKAFVLLTDDTAPSGIAG